MIAISAPVQRSRSLLALWIVERLVRAVGPVDPLLRLFRDLQLTPAHAITPDLRAVVDRATRATSRSSLANSIRSFVIDRRDVTANLARIRIPTLFIATDDRRDWTPRMAFAAARVAPKARVAVVRGARTLAALEQPTGTAKLIVEEWARRADPREWRNER